MAKQVRRTGAATRPSPAPKPDYDAGIREQLEPYGLELNDIVAVLEEDPALMKYVIQGEAGEALAATATRRQGIGGTTGGCAAGVKQTIRSSRPAPIIPLGSNGNDIQLAAQGTGGYFTVTYHTAETTDSLTNVPAGAIISWENQDNPKDRRNPNPAKKPGGFLYGHVTIKAGEGRFYSDHPETTEKNERLVMHGGRNGGPRYGSLSYVTLAKDVKFSPELIELAQMRKRERETDREIPLNEMPPKPDPIKASLFFRANPRIGYLMLKKVNPDVSFDLAADGGKNLINYYNALPQNSPERAALDLLVSKDIKNVMDYAAVNAAIDEVNDEVLRLRNPEAHARRTHATDRQISNLCSVTPTYIYQLQEMLTGNATRRNSREYREYIANLNPNSPEYQAISELAKRKLGANANPAEVKLTIANIAKDHREVKPEEINNLFQNTPALVYHVQKEFGTQKAGGIRVTSELHEYYNNLPADSPERKAINELAMAHIELSEADTPHLGEAVAAMAHHYQPNRELEPRPPVSLPSLPTGLELVPVPEELRQFENRNAIKAGFEKMDEQTWQALVDDYLISAQKDDRGQTREDMRQQKLDADQRFNAVLQNLFADNGNIDCKEVMKQSGKLLGEYLALENGEAKSLDGFIRYVESSSKEVITPTQSAIQMHNQLLNRRGR